MTLLNMVETIQSSHPGKFLARIQFDLNDALRVFCIETRILGTRAKVNAVTDKVSEDLVKNITRFALPADFHELVKVDELYKDNMLIKQGYLEIFAFDNALTEMWMDYSALPTLLVFEADSPGMPEEFHRAPLCSVMKQYYADAGDLPRAQYWSKEYSDLYKSALRYSNTRPYRLLNTLGGASKVKQAWARGVSLVAGKNTIPTNLTFTNNLYALVFNGNGVDVQATDPVTGLPDKTTTTFAVWAAIATSQFEWIASGN
jgi:hypothetical protein